MYSPAASRESIRHSLSSSGQEGVTSHENGEAGDRALMKAIRRDDVESIKRLLDSGQEDVNCQNRDGNTALMLAVQTNHVECVRCLIGSRLVDFTVQNHAGNTAFMLAVEKNNIECVRSLLESGLVEVNSQNNARNTALMLAIIYNHIACVQYILNTQLARVNVQNNNGHTALMLAAKYNHVECVRCLLGTESIDLNVQNNCNGYTALMLAATYGHSECVSLLKEKLAEVDIVHDNIQHPTLGHASRKGNYQPQNSEGNTALMLAARHGHIECTRLLLDYALTEGNNQNSEGNTAIMLAARNGHIECVKLLLNCGVIEVNHKNCEGNTAVMLAAEHGHVECARLVLNAGSIGGNEQNKEGNTALMLAARNGYAECVGFLMDTGSIEVNKQNNEGNTALMAAAKYGHIQSVGRLLDTESIEVNKQDNEENTAFIFAAEYGHLECVRRLFKSGLIELNQQNNSGNTALMAAVVNIQKSDGYTGSEFAPRINHLGCVRYLLGTGTIEVNIRNSSGNTALMLAAKGGYVKCVRLLLNPRLEVDLNTQGTEGNTAFMLAAMEGHIECVRSLLSSGLIEVNSQNNNGDTALTLAAKYGHFKCFKYLLGTGLVDSNTQNIPGDIECLRSVMESEQKERIRGDMDLTLFQAATDGDIERAKLLFEPGHSNVDRNQMQQFITICTTNGHVECIKYALDYDMNLLNVQDSEKRNLFMLAASKGHTECAVYFKEQGIDITACDHKGRTALMLASMNGHAECLKFLLEQDTAGIGRKDQDGMTAFKLAVKNGHMKCLRSFLDILVVPDSLPNYMEETRQMQEELRFESVLSSQCTNTGIRYLPGIAWREPYMYRDGQEKRSSLNLVLLNGRSSCLLCYFLKEQRHTHNSKGCPHWTTETNFRLLAKELMLKKSIDDKGNNILLTAAGNDSYACFEYLVQFMRIQCHISVLLLHKHYNELINHKVLLPRGFSSFDFDTKLPGRFERQYDAIKYLVQQGNPLGICVDFLLSAFICHCNEDGQSALALAVYNASLSLEKQDRLRLLVDHISHHHKMSIQMPNLFVTAARNLADLIYLPIFLKAEIFDWSWFPLFPPQRQRLLVRELVINGYTPGQFQRRGRPSSPLHHAFMIKDVDIVRYLVANLYLTSLDLERFQNDTELRDHLQLHGSAEVQELHRQLYSSPWRLEALSLVKISSLLRSKKRETDMARMEDLPWDIQTRLDFTNPLRWLCVRQWAVINSNFLFHHDPVSIDQTIFAKGRCCNGVCQRIKRKCRRRPQ